jgi:DNA-binding NarL/FixJ family response regulator
MGVPVTPLAAGGLTFTFLLEAEGHLAEDCRHRLVSYLNNVLEQDHRAIKRRVNASQHFRSFWGAWRTIAGYEAIHMIRKGQAYGSAAGDLVIVDITLKGPSGLELIKSIKALPIGVPVLVLSMHDESLYAERALRAGATGYITKHESADNVLLAIRRVLGGEVYLSGPMTTVFLKSLTVGGKSMARPLDRLTDRELEVLELIGHGNTTRQIAETLKLGVPTVDTHRARIKEKMNFRTATELQHFAIRWVRERE